MEDDISYWFHGPILIILPLKQSHTALYIGHP